MAHRVSRGPVGFCVDLHRRALGVFPSEFRKAHAEQLQAIVADYLADMYRQRGYTGLILAWRVLARDLIANFPVEWVRASALVPLLVAAFTITIANFSFGNDLSGTLEWAGSSVAVSLFLGLWLRSTSVATIAALVCMDTGAGSLSVWTSHHSLTPLFDDTLKWVPLSVVIMAAGSYLGAASRRAMGRHDLR